MSAPRVVLASASPRRRELLDLIGLPYVVREPDVDESTRSGESALDHALRVAADKARQVAGLDASLPVLAADTVVEVDGQTLGKPASPEEAAEMLRALSGVGHVVHTAVALVWGGRCETLVDSAGVTFVPLSDEMIRFYVATGEPMGKAGAYAVQGIGGLFVAAVVGSPQTVIGLPLHRLAELFASSGLSLLEMLRPGARR